MNKKHELLRLVDMMKVKRELDELV
jgi:hypothetical protein